MEDDPEKAIKWLRSEEGMQWSLQPKGDGGTEWGAMISLKEDVPYPDALYKEHTLGFRMNFMLSEGDCPV